MKLLLSIVLLATVALAASAEELKLYGAPEHTSTYQMPPLNQWMGDKETGFLMMEHRPANEPWSQVFIIFPGEQDVDLQPFKYIHIHIQSEVTALDLVLISKDRTQVASYSLTGLDGTLQELYLLGSDFTGDITYAYRLEFWPPGFIDNGYSAFSWDYIRKPWIVRYLGLASEIDVPEAEPPPEPDPVPDPEPVTLGIVQLWMEKFGVKKVTFEMEDGRVFSEVRDGD